MRTISGSVPSGPGGMARCDVYLIETAQWGGVTWANEGRGGVIGGALSDVQCVPTTRDRLRSTIGTEVDALTVTVQTAVTETVTGGTAGLYVGPFQLKAAALGGALDNARMTIRHVWGPPGGGVMGSVLLWDGVIGRVFPSSKSVRMEVYSHLDTLRGVQPRRIFKETCNWEYGSWQCGAAGGSCNKDRQSCSTHNFCGFPYLPPTTQAPVKLSDEEKKSQDNFYGAWTEWLRGKGRVSRPPPPRTGIQYQTATYGRPVPILFGTYRVAGNVVFNPVESYCATPVIDETEGTPPYRWVAIYMSVAFALCDVAAGGRATGPLGGLGGDRITWCWRDKRWYHDLTYLRFQAGEYHAHWHNESTSVFDTLQGPYETRDGSFGQEPFAWTAYDVTSKTRTREAFEAASDGKYVTPWEPTYPGVYLVGNDHLLSPKCTKDADFNNTSWINDVQMSELSFCMSGLGVDTPRPGADARPDYIVRTFLTAYCDWDDLIIDPSCESVYGAYCQYMNFTLSVYMNVQKPAKDWLREILDQTGGECFWSANAERGVLKFATYDCVLDPPQYIAIPTSLMLPLTEGNLIEWECRAHAETFNCVPVTHVDWQLMNGPVGFDERIAGAITDPPQFDLSGFGSASAYDTATTEFSFDLDIETHPGTSTRKDQPLDAYAVTTKYMAKQLSELCTKKSLWLRNKARIKLPWWYCALDPMDWLGVVDPDLQTGGFLGLRITAVEEGEDGESVTVEAVQWPSTFGVGPVVIPEEPNTFPWTPPGPPTPGTPNTGPGTQSNPGDPGSPGFTPVTYPLDEFDSLKSYDGSSAYLTVGPTGFAIQSGLGGNDTVWAWTDPAGMNGRLAENDEVGLIWIHPDGTYSVVAPAPGLTSIELTNAGEVVGRDAGGTIILHYPADVIG